MVQIQGTPCRSHWWVCAKHGRSYPWACSEGVWGEQRYCSAHS